MSPKSMFRSPYTRYFDVYPDAFSELQLAFHVRGAPGPDDMPRTIPALVAGPADAA